jgi:hypothetical protein
MKKAHYPGMRIPLPLLTTLICAVVFVFCAAAAGASFVQRGQFGGEGSGNGQFGTLAPVGLGVDRATGDLYAADGFASRVEKFDAQGDYISQFGSEGSGDGQFQNTGGVAVDQSTGDVYVVDELGDRVEKFDSSGNFVLQFGSFGSGDGQFASGFFSFANVVAVDSSGDVYVADPGNARVEKFDSSGAYLSQITTGLSSPRGVAVDLTDNLYVADPGSGAVQKFNSAGVYQSSIAAGTNPNGVSTDATGDLFVFANEPEAHILEYDALGAQIGDFGSGSLTSNLFFSQGMTFGDSAGLLYVTDFANHRVVVFGPPVAVPDVSTGSASNAQTTSASLNGTVNPNGEPVTECLFEYGAGTSYRQSAPCAQDPGSGTDAVAVSADIGGLQPNTTYHFRLRAANANAFSATDGQDQSFTTPGPPTVDAESATEVASTEALLRAQINPRLRDTTYHFEYGPSTAYGTNIPAPDADLGAGNSDQLASVQLGGLQPSSTYHYRVVAQNSVGTTNGPDRTFITFAPSSGKLPDDRAYELITPAEKLGNSIGLPGDPSAVAVAADGQHVLYDPSGAGSFGDATNGGRGRFLAARTSSGWQSTSVAAPVPAHPHVNDGDGPVGASSDFSMLFYETATSSDPNDQNGTFDVYARDPDGTFAWVSQSNAVSTAPIPSRYVATSADGSHVLFRTNQALTPDDAAQVAGSALYDRVAGHTDLVGVKTDGSLTSACGAVLGDANLTQQENVLAHDAVSNDGRRLFFESPDPDGSGDSSCSPLHGGNQPVEVYLREGATTTTEISLSQKTGSVGTPAPDGATYRGASRDGSRVFFTSPDQLTDNTAAASGGVAEGLYGYDVATGSLTFIANGRPLRSLQRAPMISDDGTRLYFIGNVPGTGPDNSATGGSLYLWDDGRISYISRAPSEGFSNGSPDAGVSPDASTLVFTTPTNLTEYDSQGYLEAYVYKAATGSLVCISCDPNGIPPVGSATLGFAYRNLSSLAVTSDGSRVFFDSPDPLLPQVTNGLRNVYEYENGTLNLLSDGNGPYQSLLAGASSDGTDVIINTADSLVPQDTDHGDGDLYDVRVGGGFAQPPTANPCSGDACQGPVSVNPSLPVPASMEFTGLGNRLPVSPAPAIKVRVAIASVRGSTFVLSVKVPSKGRLSGRGAQVMTVNRSVARAGTYRLAFRLTASAQRALKHKRTLKVNVRVAYTPGAGRSSSAAVAIKLEA